MKALRLLAQCQRMHQTMPKARGQPEVRDKELEMKAEITAELMERKCDSREDSGMDGWSDGGMIRGEVENKNVQVFSCKMQQCYSK